MLVACGVGFLEMGNQELAKAITDDLVTVYTGQVAGHIVLFRLPSGERTSGERIATLRPADIEQKILRHLSEHRPNKEKAK